MNLTLLAAEAVQSDIDTVGGVIVSLGVLILMGFFIWRITR